jgi:hypothetical protein
MYIHVNQKYKSMKRFKVIKRKFKIDDVNELSKGCRVSRIISCVVEDLDSGELMKIKSSTTSDLEKTIINKIDDFDLECGDVFIIRE